MDNASSKRSFLVFLCLACLALPIAADSENPDLKAYPDANTTATTSLPKASLGISEKNFWMKRSFAQGQPELEQAMDNMLIRERMIKRNIQFPPADVNGYPALLTHKTAYLLAEAEHMLNRVKNLRERRWVEAFVHRLKMLAAVLEQSVSASNKGFNISTRGSIQSLEQPLAAEKHLFFTPSSTSTSDAPDFKEENPKNQSNQMPEADGQMAKTGLVQQLRNKKLDEDDELVRELENLHVIALENRPQSATPPATTAISAHISSVPSAKRMSPMTENDQEMENEKEKIKNFLTDEVAALQRLGGTPEEIMSTLQLNPERFIGFKDPESDFSQNPITGKEVQSLETEKNFLGNMNTEVKDVHSEESMVSQANRHAWRPTTLVHPASYPSKDMYSNKSFQGMHMNLPRMNEQALSRHFQNGPKNLPHEAFHLPPHYNGIKNSIEKLQGPDFQFNNHIVHEQQALQNGRQGIPAPVEMKQNQFIQNDGNNNFNPSLDTHRPGSTNRHGYSPYPYFSSINHKNSSMYGAQSFPSHNIGNNFSDEMKRQLRDGKVILLSDNVVRSNFEQTPEKDKDANDKTEAPQEFVKSEGKNETQAQK